MNLQDMPSLAPTQTELPPRTSTAGEPFKEPAADGYSLGGFTWSYPRQDATRPVVIINAATSVRCRHYSRFADYLYANGFDVITYDYRGIGESRPASLKGLRASWSDWGALDFEAMLKRAQREFPGQPIDVVGHSFGGCAAGLGASGHMIRRLVTVGAQFAYWRDYAPAHRWRMFGKWHLVMPLMTLLCGYFPGKRLGWLKTPPLAWFATGACPPRTTRNAPAVASFTQNPGDCPSHPSPHKTWPSASATILTARFQLSNACWVTSPTARTPTCESPPKTSANKKSDISPFFVAHTKPHYGPLHCPGCRPAN